MFESCKEAEEELEGTHFHWEVDEDYYQLVANATGFPRESITILSFAQPMFEYSSNDKTLEILQKLSKDYSCIKISDWRECKELLDNIDIN